MSTLPDLATQFHALEKLAEAQPEGVTAEIVRGVYLMSPRPRVRNAAAQLAFARILDSALGRGNVRGSMNPDRRAEAGALNAAPFDTVAVRLDDVFAF